MRRALALLALAALGACAPRFEQAARMMADPVREPREPVLERRRSYHDGDLARLEAEWTVLVDQDGAAVAHGRRTEFHPDGRLAAEREFDHGAPSGRWRAWYPDGTPQMEADFDGDPGAMRWFHPNGALASEGPLRAGARDGLWSHHREDGSLESRGPYAAGRRHGEWTFFHPDGSIAERGRFEAGVRAGEWRRFPPPAA